MRNSLLATLLALSILAPAMVAGAADAPANPLIEVGIDLSADGPLFTYITGKPYKVTVKVENKGKDEVQIDKIDVTCKADKDLAVEVKPDGAAPATVAAGASASAAYNVVFPDQAAGRQVSLTANVQCGDKSEKAEAVALVSPPFEITLLPSRLILDAEGGTRNVGTSVINHTDSPFQGKIKFTSYPGIEVKPADVDAKIDPLGLEAFALSVSPAGSPAPGHYAVFVDVGGKAKDWVAVDVPVAVKKAIGGTKVDGDFAEWKDAATVSISRILADGGYQTVGKAMFTSDAVNFYAAFEINDAKHDLSPDSKSRAHASPPSDSVQIAFDPLLDGAAGSGGGYKQDDLEYLLLGAEGGSVMLKTVAGAKPEEIPTGFDLHFKRDGGKSLYEATFPWTELKIKSEKGKMFAISILVNDSDGSKVTQYEFGGGIAGNVDPRRFVPVILAD